MSFLNFRTVLKEMAAQLEALRQRPELNEGLPRPLSVLEADRDTLSELERAQAAAKNAIKLATAAVQQALFEGKGKLAANRAITAMKYGPYSAEFVAVGGKPRRRVLRPTSADATVAEPKPAETPPASVEEAA